ncbi:MAG: hypothetical protein V4710_15700 [Verrucomicrobiota bacterium]
MTHLPREFPELIALVQAGLVRRGFHFLSTDELQHLWGSDSPRNVKLKRLREFARACGAAFEIDPRFCTARLVPLRETSVKREWKTGVPATLWQPSGKELGAIGLAA